MNIDINSIIEIFTQKIGEKEKENVLLQAQIIQLNKHIEGLNEKIEELENKEEVA